MQGNEIRSASIRPMMKILVTFAVEAEFAPWRRVAKLCRHNIGGITIHRAAFGRALVDFLVTGIGAENAIRAVDAALTPSHQFCIASGFAGALRPDYSVGDILVARAVRRRDKPEALECSASLFQSAVKQGAKPASVFLTTDAVVGTAFEKSQLAPLADAVDMETFGVLSVAHAKSRPAVAIRVVSDRFDANLPADIHAMVDHNGHVRVGGVLRAMSRHPSQLPALIRLGRDSHAAAGALARYLQAFITELSLTVNESFPQAAGFAEVTAR